jgi:hypothetical protein
MVAGLLTAHRLCSLGVLFFKYSSEKSEGQVCVHWTDSFRSSYVPWKSSMVPTYPGLGIHFFVFKHPSNVF